MNSNRIIVIGGGASGMMAAGRAAELGGNVLLLEKTDSLGKKILISGKTRCNLTNIRDLDDFIRMYGPNGRFLYSAFHRFFRDDLLELMERYGVQTKTERGGRVFPTSDNANDIIGAFDRYLSDFRVEMRTKAEVIEIQKEGNRVIGVRTTDELFPAGAVILATGGASFPATGSTGDGYRMAAKLGHTVLHLRPGLVPLAVKEAHLARSMQGVALRNVRLTAYQCHVDEIEQQTQPAVEYGRGLRLERAPWPIIESRMGEMMFTHFGIGGPITLQMSLAIVDALKTGPVTVSVDLKPGLDSNQLDTRLRRDFDAHGKQGFKRLLSGLLPRKMIEPFVGLTGIDPAKLAHQITSEERKRVLNLLKSLPFNVRGPLPLSSAMVTVGGVSLGEIDPRTMASRSTDGLFFCGEVMDLDADTGGYNLQAAFSTGYVAGEEAKKFSDAIS